jgi:hypothetical protein
MFVIGLASHQTENELNLLQRLPNVPVVVVEDVPGASLRPKAEGFFKKRSATALVALSQWRKFALDFGYDRVEYLGPPPHWGPSYRIMTEGEDLRSQFRKRDRGITAPLGSEDEVIFFGGIKDSSIVNRVLRLMREAGIGDSDEPILGFKDHPGEEPKRPGENASKKEKDVFGTRYEKYIDAKEERDQILSGAAMFDSGKATLPQIIRGVDLTIFTGGSTDSIIAAYARLPIAYFTDEEVVADYNLQVGRPGSWFVAELGGAYVFRPDNFVGGIQVLRTHEGRAALREMQKQNFPLPGDWDTASRIVRFLEEEVIPRAA